MKESLSMYVDTVRLVTLDWTDDLAKVWEAAEVHALAEVIRPTRANGFEYECTIAGQSAAREPKWSEAALVDAELTDGSVEWTAQIVSNDSLRATIATATWDGGGLTVDDDDIVSTNGEQKVQATLTGDTAGVYTVTVTVTFSDGTSDKGVLTVTLVE